MPGNIKNVIAAIDYIESHLHEKLDLDTIAGALHYSKYHLYRMFTGMVGLIIQTYAQRRWLTEATKLLVSTFSCFLMPLIEGRLGDAGYYHAKVSSFACLLYCGCLLCGGFLGSCHFCSWLREYAQRIDGFKGDLAVCL